MIPVFTAYKHIRASFLMIAFLMLLPPAIMAQENSETGSSVSISASANVISGDIDIETISDMGIVTAQQIQEGDIIRINPIMDAEAGIMRAIGQPNARIRVSYLEEMEISRREGPGVLYFDYQVSGHPGDNQSGSELIEEIEREMEFNEEGEFYFFIGGTIDMSGAIPGNYDGEFIIEIEYM